MKFQKRFRMPLILAGLGAAFLLAGSGNAQEITNTEFSDGPYVVAFEQPAFAQAIAASMPVLTESQALQAMAAISMPAVAEEDTVESSSLERWVVSGILLFTFCGIGLCGLAETGALTKQRRTTTSLRSSAGARVSSRAA